MLPRDVVAMVRIAIVGDYTLIRKLLKLQVEIEQNFVVVGEMENSSALADIFPYLHPDVILVDIDMNGKEGIRTVQKIHEAIPGVKIITLSLEDSYNTRRQAITAGADCHVSKQAGSPTLVSAIHRVVQDKSA
jgi:two-component system, NarL family, nitrate/nitrite response regulator NarL